MGRTLEEILAQEDPHMVADARRLAAEILLDIEKAECASLDRGAAEESPIQQKATDSN